MSTMNTILRVVLLTLLLGALLKGGKGGGCHHQSVSRKLKTENSPVKIVTTERTHARVFTAAMIATVR
jgi:hypothetical protein